MCSRPGRSCRAAARSALVLEGSDNNDRPLDPAVDGGPSWRRFGRGWGLGREAGKRSSLRARRSWSLNEIDIEHLLFRLSAGTFFEVTPLETTPPGLPGVYRNLPRTRNSRSFNRVNQ